MLPVADAFAQSPAEGSGILALLPDTSTTDQAIDMAGRPFAYQATAGTLPIRDGSGATTAEMFYTSYAARDGGCDGEVQSDRPISFVFNGGPGAASAYLHLGGIGPRAIAVDAEDGAIPAPPARLVDNPDTWLCFTDLVFVDPVGTGYSRAADPSKERDFWGVIRDRDVMAAFIRLYLARESRLTSPVYLVGESYGGFRAALLAEALPEESGVAPSGLVLISPALDFSLLFGNETGNILQPALILPSMAAVRLEAEAQLDRAEMAERLRPAETYALGDYLQALAAGPEATREEASERVSDLTGLPLDIVRRAYGTVSPSTFIKAFNRDTGEVLSRYDGNLAGPDPDPGSFYPGGPDAVLDRMSPIWTAATVSYLRSELGYATDVTYRLLNREVNGGWDYGNGRRGQGYVDAMDELQEARALLPEMKVMITNGYSDLVTTYLTSRFLVDQLPPLAGAEPIELRTYLGGHMMYLRADSRAALRSDVAALYGEDDDEIPAAPTGNANGDAAPETPEGQPPAR